ncbi:GIY-YIG nuclease family protein [Microbispora rosea]|uniref:GIY-YIG nuclease family protein n=1 Tax=Microbispora rosea TaxID=58117 RepID=UPI00055EA779|nr:GIY-YIG nuclease family protein [Microbispora rosea]
MSTLKDVLAAFVEAGVQAGDLHRALDAVTEDLRRQVTYFVERHGFVKIGTTSDLRSRIASLNRGDSAIPGMTVSPVNLLAVMPGGRPVERAIHQTFAKLRFDGEWFLFDEPLVGFVRSVAAAAEETNPAVQDIINRAHRDAQAAARGRTTRTHILTDVRQMFRDGERHLPWHLLADRLSEAIPNEYGGITQEALSAEVRAFKVPSVDGKRGGVVRKGVKRLDLESAIQRQQVSATEGEFQCLS